MITADAVECLDCGTPLDRSQDIEGQPLVPCPNCGSIARLGKIAAEDEWRPCWTVDVGIHGKSDATRRGTNRAKRHLQEFHHRTGPSADGVRRIAHQTYDRDLDLYEETIIEEGTGWLYRWVREPLGAHRGRGAAKSQKLTDACSWAISSIRPEDRHPTATLLVAPRVPR